MPNLPTARPPKTLCANTYLAPNKSMKVHLNKQNKPLCPKCVLYYRGGSSRPTSDTKLHCKNMSNLGGLVINNFGLFSFDSHQCSHGFESILLQYI